VFNLSNDPGEKQNLVKELPHIKEEYHGVYDTIINPESTKSHAVNLSEETLDQLRALGYIT